MTDDEILKLFYETDVLKTGHFLLTSGRHSNKYLQCAQLLQYPKATEQVVKKLAENVKDLGIQTVIGPAMGGIIVSYEMARQLDARAIFTERGEDGKMALRRGFTIKPGEKVLVVEDVVTTGGSVKEVISVVKELKGDIAAVAALVDRSGGKVDFGVPAYYALNLEVESYLPEECPLCKENIPIEKPGSRKKQQ
ncbi:MULTISPECIES: orotate phosphoribosyltransferase [Tepidanaerobacter]|uniref:Orotate phosphoribosyltransferase n=2 Tax=Tepidanaerobacter syntrophicus TaxID=224999 RepID=A0A0U9HG92_9FIRM|nr:MULTISPECIES: orotate phosphoribosyltransferase [Tepidanaerobacter]GAQ25709.1 orotate phosphoribosyltransferase [Tepidanaerobacter syntrophicus]GLI20072.1 orotate phosphoribosyltransferase [Tepidanaerobacter syntrophicus]GLI51480.1 orotate phosphoribosyltransferase [Tepidanaerobacter syntrophicus]HHV84194.1 orotate phosphoribosyltransferase [Tepidanaerobacter syntrophicus]